MFGTHLMVSVNTKGRKWKTVHKPLTITIPCISKIVQTCIAEYDHSIFFCRLDLICKIKIPAEIPVCITCNIKHLGHQSSEQYVVIQFQKIYQRNFLVFQ